MKEQKVMYYTGDIIYTVDTDYGYGFFLSEVHIVIPYHVNIEYTDILYEDEDADIRICKVPRTSNFREKSLFPPSYHNLSRFITGDLVEEKVMEPNILQVYQEDNTAIYREECNETFLRIYELSRPVTFGDSGKLLYCLSSNNRYTPIGIIVARDKLNEYMCYCLYFPKFFYYLGYKKQFIEETDNQINIFNHYTITTKMLLSNENLEFVSDPFGIISKDVATQVLTTQLGYDRTVPNRNSDIFKLDIWNSFDIQDFSKYLKVPIPEGYFDSEVLNAVFTDNDNWKTAIIKAAFCACEESGSFEDKCWVVQHEKINSRDQPRTFFKKVSEFMLENEFSNKECDRYYIGSTKVVTVEGLNLGDGNVTCHHPLLCERNEDCKGIVIRKNGNSPYISHCCIKPSHLCNSSKIFNKLGEILQHMNTNGEIRISMNN